jgi:type VI protein secretion system component VasF
MLYRSISPVDIRMAVHQDARYIPPRRERDRSSRRWRDRSVVWFVLAAVVMVVVALFIGARYLSYS